MPTGRLASRDRLRALLRRRRRPLAGLAAGAATLVALLAILAPRPAAPEPEAPGTPGLAAGEVAVPVAVARGADLVGPGTRIDLVVATGEQPHADVIAHDASVLEAQGSGALSGTATTILVAMSREEALAVAAVPVDSALTMLILER